jgi:hypothetical protein
MHEDVDIEELLDRLLDAVVDAFRNENLEPEWAAESS